MTIDDNGPRATLADSRVDLIGMVQGEIPEPAYVPAAGHGSEGASDISSPPAPGSARASPPRSSRSRSSNTAAESSSSTSRTEPTSTLAGSVTSSPPETSTGH